LSVLRQILNRLKRSSLSTVHRAREMGVSVHSKRRKRNVRNRAKLIEPWLKKQQEAVNATFVHDVVPKDEDVPIKMEIDKQPATTRRRARVVVVE
jgi:hypothetical protein